MKREQLLERVEKGWQGFRQEFTGLPEREMMRSGVSGEWSVRDLICHISWWEEEALSHLPAVLDGRRPPRYSTTYGGIDAFNARRTTENAALPVATLLQRSEETHGRLMRYVQGLPAARVEANGRFQRRLRLDTYGHYKLHGRDIRAWREA